MTVQGSDSFAAAPILPFGASSALTSPAGMGMEPGESTNYGGAGAATMWWKFTAPRTCNVNVDALQSVYTWTVDGDQYNVQVYLSVWQGSAVDALTFVAHGGYAYDYVDPYVYALGELDFTATAGQTYYVRASVPSWSNPIDVKVRVAEAVYEWSGWQQLPDYEIDTANPSYQSLAGGTGGAFYSSATHYYSPPEVNPAHSQAAVDAAVPVAKTSSNATTTGVPGSLGYAATYAVDQTTSPDWTSEYHGVEEGHLRLLHGQNNHDRASLTPINEYHYSWEFAGAKSALVAAYYDIPATTARNYIGSGVNQQQGSASAQVSVVVCPAAPGLEATFPSWDYASFTGTTARTYAITGTDGTVHASGTVDLTAAVSGDDHRVMVKWHPASPVMNVANPTEGAYVGLEGAGGTLRWTFRPPLIRFQDKRLISEGVPVLRVHPRGDGRGLSSARRVWPPSKTTQDNRWHPLGGGYR